MIVSIFHGCHLFIIAIDFHYADELRRLIAVSRSPFRRRAALTHTYVLRYIAARYAAPRRCLLRRCRLMSAAALPRVLMRAFMSRVYESAQLLTVLRFPD